MNKVVINGRLVPMHQAKVSILDRSYLYGEGLFETLRAYDGVPAFPILHFHRLRDNCARLGIALPWTERAFTQALRRVLRANGLLNAALRVTVSPVGSSPAIDRPQALRSNTVIFARPLQTKPKRCYRDGASVIIVASVTAEPASIGNLKSTSYLRRMLARREVAAAKADEGLLCHARGWFVEGTASNLFLVRNGRITTSPLGDGALPGVTRSVVMDLAATLGLSIQEGHLTRARVTAADELFLTGSTTEILPVREVRGLTRKHPTPGPITKQLMLAYQTLLEGT